ncbi:MAG: P1 family peptidase [Actinomycetes bacterium]
MALGLPDVRVGTWEHPHVPTGCTVVLPPAGTLGAVAVRGAAPGTREAAALGPAGKLTVCHAVVLAGGSAYGLAAADGVARALDADGIGYPVGPWRVPIVGAAIVLDVAVAFPDARPDAAAGAAAVAAATTDDPAQGAVGAGAGATVAKVAGLAGAWRGGQGWAVRRHGDLVVGALVVNNAVGEVVDEDGTVLTPAVAPAGAPRFPLELRSPADAGHGDAPSGPGEGGPTGATVIGCVVTNARLDKAEAHRVADLAHGGVVRAVVPAHTTYDGDALFCLATGEVETTVDAVAHLAVEAVAEAARAGPRHATGRPALSPPSGPTFPAVPGLADA